MIIRIAHCGMTWKILIAQCVAFFMDTIGVLLLILKTLIGQVNKLILSVHVVFDARGAEVARFVEVKLVLGSCKSPQSDIKLSLLV